MQFGNRGGQGHDGRRKRVELVVPIFSNKNSESDSKTSGIKPRYKHKTRSDSERHGEWLPQGISGPQHRICVFRPNLAALSMCPG